MASSHRAQICAAMLAGLLWPALVDGQTARRPSSTLRGIVYDSIARAPLAGAVVQALAVEGRDGAPLRRVTTTDSLGRYALDLVPQGALLIGFYHAKLDSLGMELPVQRVDSMPAEAPGVDLAVPSAATVRGTACGPVAPGDSAGLIAGFLQTPEHRQPVEDGAIEARWREIVIDLQGARAVTRKAVAQSGPGGWFAVCGVPAGGLVLVRASAGSDTGSFVELEVPPHGVLLRSLYLSEASRRNAATPPTGGAAQPAARAALQGTVVSPYGEPLPHVRVRLWGTGYEGITNEHGAFALAGLEPGTHTLEALSIGRVPTRVAVDLFPGGITRAAITMPDFPTVIDTVRVLARRPSLPESPSGFEYRKNLGFGVHIDAREIERRIPTRFTDLLRGLQGVTFAGGSALSPRVMLAGNGSEALCEPLIVLDGVRIPLDGMNLDDLIPPHLVRAVEVYVRRIEAPPQFQTRSCGTIVVWTHGSNLPGRRTTPRKPSDER